MKVHMETPLSTRDVSVGGYSCGGLIIEAQEHAWSDVDLQATLKIRLGANHRIIISLQRKLNKRIQPFSRKLKLEENGQLLQIALNETIDEKTRKRFSKSFRVKAMGGFNTKEYGALLEEIDRDIEKLSKLLHSTIQLEPIKMKKGNKLHCAY